MIKIRIIFLLFFILILLTACNSRKDVNHISQNDMINYVKKAVGEKISLVNVTGNESENVMTYVFKLDDRNVTF